MKKILGKGILALFVIGILYIIYLQECERDPGTPEGYILVNQIDWDSMIVRANRPPQITIDTFYLKGDPVYLPGKEIPIPVIVGVDTNLYQDSIMNDSINVGIDIVVAGTILHWDWWYNPITSRIETIIEKPAPFPFPVETPIYKRELFLSGVIGGNMNAFTFGADLDLVNKKRNIYGIQYRRFGDENFYYFKVGTKLFKNR